MKNLDWDDCRLFLVVARAGSLTGAIRDTRLSQATLSRRLRRLEESIGRTLFVRSQTGYELTEDGRQLLSQARAMEAVVRGVESWAGDAEGQTVVRLVAGSWISRLLCENFEAINPDPSRIHVSMVTGEQRASLAYRESDIGMRSQRPTETYLAARRVSLVAYGQYVRRNANASVRGRRVAVRPEEALSAYLRHPHELADLPIVAAVSRPVSLLDLARAGAGMAVLPCFVGDLDPDLERVGGLVDGLTHEQWLVVNAEDRDRRPIRDVFNRVSTLLASYRDVFEGKRPSRVG